MAHLHPSGQIQEPQPTAEAEFAFFRLAFRPLFLLGALFSLLSIATWALTFTGYLEFNPYGGSYFWHVHEMLFGFASAIICGFLLTAVQTWTGQPSIKGAALATLVLLWLAARVLMAFGSFIPTLITMLLDVAFLATSAYYLARPILAAKQWRNLFFVPILFTMAMLNLAMHLAIQGKLALSFIHLSHIMVLMVALVMVIMGGRVFPMFTANGTKTQRVDAIPLLEHSAIASLVLCIVMALFIAPKEPLVVGSCFIFAAVVNFVRALRWRIWVTFKTPLVWSLHLSYWAICIGLFMIGAYYLQWLSNLSLALHAITVGGMGLMILSMISRVSLGHTGRMIQVGKVVSAAFILMVMSFLLRVFAPLLGIPYPMLILSSAAAWVIAYLIFVVRYTPILMRSRLDGRDG